MHSSFIDLVACPLSQMVVSVGHYQSIMKNYSNPQISIFSDRFRTNLQLGREEGREEEREADTRSQMVIKPESHPKEAWTEAESSH